VVQALSGFNHGGLAAVCVAGRAGSGYWSTVELTVVSASVVHSRPVNLDGGRCLVAPGAERLIGGPTATLDATARRRVADSDRLARRGGTARRRRMSVVRASGLHSAPFIG